MNRKKIRNFFRLNFLPFSNFLMVAFNFSSFFVSQWTLLHCAIRKKCHTRIHKHVSLLPDSHTQINNLLCDAFHPPQCITTLPDALPLSVTHYHPKWLINTLSNALSTLVMLHHPPRCITTLPNTLPPPETHQHLLWHITIFHEALPPSSKHYHPLRCITTLHDALPPSAMYYQPP